MRALIIDDSRANRMVLAKFLREFGFETVESESALDAIWTLKQRTDIDLITVDFNMPKMTGIQFARLVREKPELDKVQIMMITSEDNRHEEAIEAGINEYLVKPFDRSMVEEKLMALGINPKSASPPVESDENGE